MSMQSFKVLSLPFGARITHTSKTANPVEEPVTETRSATTRARLTDLDAIERLYVLIDRPTVRAFLTQRPFLIPLLFEAYEEIGTFFTNAPLRLTLVIDPEEDDRHLQLSIVTALDPEQGIARLHELDEAWWLDNLGRGRNALSFSIAPHEL